MPDPITFAAAHALTAVDNPNAPAIVFPDQTLGHDQIRRLGLAFAARMQAAGVGPGSRVQLPHPRSGTGPCRASGRVLDRVRGLSLCRRQCSASFVAA